MALWKNDSTDKTIIWTCEIVIDHIVTVVYLFCARHVYYELWQTYHATYLKTDVGRILLDRSYNVSVSSLDVDGHIPTGPDDLNAAKQRAYALGEETCTREADLDRSADLAAINRAARAAKNKS